MDKASAPVLLILLKYVLILGYNSLVSLYSILAKYTLEYIDVGLTHPKNKNPKIVVAIKADIMVNSFTNLNLEMKYISNIFGMGSILEFIHCLYVFNV